MNDLDTFSGAQAKLLELGFLAGFKTTWKWRDGEDFLYIVFIHPQTNAVIELEERLIDKVFKSRITACWKLKNADIDIQQTRSKLCTLGERNSDFWNREIKSMDKSKTQSLSHYCVDDISGLIKLSEYISSIGDFISWSGVKQPCLLTYTESQIKSISDNWVAYSLDRLNLAISNLNLNPVNFGIK